MSSKKYLRKTKETTSIKYMAENLHKLLLHVFNISLQNESFPNEIKIPFIFIYKNPLFKNGRDLGNYRPISVLPCF